MYNLPLRLSSPIFSIYLLSKKDMAVVAVCGDALTVNRAYNTSEFDQEECDDGNLLQFDGCSDKCFIERGFTCFPNTSNAALPHASKCTAPAPAAKPNRAPYINIFISFGSPLIVVVALFLCCLTVKRLDPSVWKKMMPYGIHEKVLTFHSGLKNIMAPW
jgi:cysteine-rich repeat protein